MPVIGLTGNIASGKSLVSGILMELGASIIDADQVARDIVEPGTPVMEKIKLTFGEQVLNPDGTLDRKSLGKMVFAEPTLLKRLNEITHPAIVQKILQQIEAFRQNNPGGESVLIIDAALLFEVGMPEFVDEIWVVDVAEDEQVRRLMNRDGLDREQAMARINSQMPAAEKRKMADLIIDNSGDMAATREFIEKTWHARFGSRRGGYH